MLTPYVTCTKYSRDPCELMLTIVPRDLRDHQLRGVPRRHVRRPRADAQHVVPVRDRRGEERLLVPAALGQVERAVDEHVEGASLLAYASEHGRDLVVGPQVTHDRHRDAAQLLGFLHRAAEAARQRAVTLVQGAPEDVDGGSGGRELEHAAAPDTP